LTLIGMVDGAASGSFLVALAAATPRHFSSQNKKVGGSLISLIPLILALSNYLEISEISEVSDLATFLF
jgi:hypothetical protein